MTALGRFIVGSVFAIILILLWILISNVAGPELLNV